MKIFLVLLYIGQKNNKCGVFKDNVVFFGGSIENKGTIEQHIKCWLDKCNKYNIKYWQFQDEIAPD